MDYKILSDSEINRKVADIIYRGDQNITPYSHRPDVQVFHKNNCNTMKDYCNNPADAWPIIEANAIGIMPFKKDEAEAWSLSAGLLSNTTVKHQNPLRAAMIVFLMMQGDE